MADLTPTETLRAAATLLRETASRTLGITRPWRYSPGKPSDSVRTESGWEVAYGDDPSNLRWIALASPTLAEPLSAWLETCASDLADAPHHIGVPNPCKTPPAGSRPTAG